MEKLGRSAAKFIYEAAMNFNSAAELNKAIIKYQVILSFPFNVNMVVYLMHLFSKLVLYCTKKRKQY